MNAFDKTGTLTHGHPSITAVHALDAFNGLQLLQIATALKKRSGHPLAIAFADYAAEKKIPDWRYEMSDFRAMPGKGVRATIDGRRYFLGSRHFIEESITRGRASRGSLKSESADGGSSLFLSDDRSLLGAFDIRERVRRSDGDLMNNLRDVGIKRTVLLTGDGRPEMKEIDRHFAFDEIKTGMMPEDKVAAIEDLRHQYGKVAIVGDGVNDTPALAHVDVGIAMGGAGSDIVLEHSDVVLMADDLGKLPHAPWLGKNVLSTIRFNIMFAVAVKAVFVVLGVHGISSLWLAILADDGVTLLVALNGMRLLRMRSS